MSKLGRVAVAMSGGVDSSVAAAWLVEQGYEVVGLSMQLWDHGEARAGSRTCCAMDDLYDARRVADRLGIAHYVINMEEAFRHHVVEAFVDAYARGLTPNPCIACNQWLKFDLLLGRALQLGAQFLATGHYAVVRGDDTGSPQLWKGRDRIKDQSYFLFATTRAQLVHLRFPLGEMEKSQTRDLAHRHGLHLADKGESQDLCFVPDGDYAAFFARHGGSRFGPGEIVDNRGRVLGQHRGLGCYTIGQRRGLGISAPHPLYVTAIEVSGNRLRVGPEEELFTSELTIAEVNWLGEEPQAELFCATARIRYASCGEEAECRSLPGGRMAVRFQQPQRAVAPGQACVLYHGERVLGGGWIEQKEAKG